MTTGRSAQGNAPSLRRKLSSILAKVMYNWKKYISDVYATLNGKKKKLMECAFFKLFSRFVFFWGRASLVYGNFISGAVGVLLQLREVRLPVILLTHITST